MTMTENGVEFSLTKNQALVLFEWLSRENPAVGTASPFEDQAEQQVLWILEGKLEKHIDELFSPDYRRALIAARGAVRDNPTA